MHEYKIEVKPWMLKKSTGSFRFMSNFNNDIPMPLLIMYTGGIVDKINNRVRLNLHGDIKQRVTSRCMSCGRPITNKISQYFGIGPICGGHNYTNPFDTEDELNKAIQTYREKLVNTTWLGWIPLSAIVSIDDITDPRIIQAIFNDMPIEIIDNDPEIKESSAPKTNGITINVNVATPVKGTDDYSAFVSCKYNTTVLAAIKDIRKDARHYDPDTKVWEIDYHEFNELRSVLSDFTFNITGEELLPGDTIIPEDYQFKTIPMEHQTEGILYGLDHSRFLLGDEQGLGKTKEVIDLACIRKATMGIKHCLIICGVNSLKWNWVEEVEKHSTESAWVLGQVKKKRSGRIVSGGNPDKIADLDKLANPVDEMDYPYFLITNVESLRNSEIAEKLGNLCSTGIIGMVAIDESHHVKNLDTLQGAGLMQIQPYYRVAMTGTPLITTPLDLYAQLKWLGYQPYEFKQFKYHFCEYDEWGSIIGYKNIDQLKDQLAAIMIRRKKKEVLDLPDKVYVNEYVELTEEQKKLYNQVITKVIEDPEIANQISLECQLAIKLRLRQVSGGIGPFSSIKINPKLDRMEQLVEEAVYSGTKVIVFSNWLESTDKVVKRLQKYNPVIITGDVKDTDRQESIHRFQNDDSVKVICCTVDAAGVGITLTAATTVIFMDEPWSSAVKEQAIDRCHRIGTTSSITIYTLMSYGTYDEKVHDIVMGKKEMSDSIVDKKTLRSWKVA